jgi:hypothetical protein
MSGACNAPAIQRRTVPLFFVRANSRKLALIFANSPGGTKP